MRVLIVHNRYQQAGGEDAVVRDEATLLAQRGVVVELFERSNAELDPLPRLDRLAGTIWSRENLRAVRERVQRLRADVVHVHNTFAVLSPAVLWAAAAGGAAVVVTLHNFRLMCLQAMFLRNGRLCEDCLGRVPWRGVVRRCYRDSMAASAWSAAINVTHRALRTWERQVDRYIALNAYCASKFVAAGLPAQRIAIKPNFVDIAAPEPRPRAGGLFVGRLAAEKGLAVLAEAVALPLAGRQFRELAPRVTVVGEGPLHNFAAASPGLQVVGPLSADAVQAHMQRAAYLVLPSIWSEQFPRVLVEAFACGLPVIASNTGALAELIREGETGMLFPPRDAAALRARLDWADRNPEAMAEMGRQARAWYERHYTPSNNYTRLVNIYRAAMAERDATRSAPPWAAA